MVHPLADVFGPNRESSISAAAMNRPLSGLKEAVYEESRQIYNATADFGPFQKQSLDSLEVVQQEWVALERCIEMIFSQQILDSLSVASNLALEKVIDEM